MSKCDLCGGKLHKDNKVGVCKRNSECLREWRHRWWARIDSEYRRKSSDHITVVLRNAKQRAKAESFPFSLVKTDIPALPKDCPCCGAELIRGGPWRNQPSLDRLIPARGYVAGNVQWLCRRCNLVKSNATPEELMRMALFLKDVIKCVS